MKAFQAKFMKEQQEVMQRSLRELTEKGEYMAIFSMMKNQVPFKSSHIIDISIPK